MDSILDRLCERNASIPAYLDAYHSGTDFDGVSLPRDLW